MKCSICSNEINDKYCSTCGQYFRKERITSISILKDLFGNIFSLEKSLFKNIKMGLLQPRILISNYWNGFRAYYYSPSRFLVLAALFFLLQLTLFDDFLGITVTSKYSQQFTLLLFNIILFTILSFIIYLKFKKSFYEHLILNIYNVSLWSIIFVPISIILNLLHTPKTIETSFIVLYLLLIIIWNARTFKMNYSKRIIYIFLNITSLVLILFMIFKFGTTTK